MGFWRFLLFALMLGALACNPGDRSAPVSRVQSDLRSVASGLDLYRADNGAYPPPAGGAAQRLDAHWFTTPVAHFTDGIDDLFKIRILRGGHPLRVFLVKMGFFSGALLLALSTLAIAVWVGGGRRRSLVSLLLLGAIAPTLVLSCIRFLAEWDTSRGRSRTYTVRNSLWQSGARGFNYWTDGTARWVLQSAGPDGDRDLLSLEQIPPWGGDVSRAQSFVADLLFDPTNGVESSGDILRFSLPAE